MGRKVKLLVTGRGNYGRLLAYIIADGTSLNLLLLKTGLARMYTGDFAPKNPATFRRYLQAQEKAKGKGLGIWKTASRNR